MSEKFRAELDFRQNIAIALLSVLAAFLFSRTELFNMGWETLRNSVFPSPPDRAAAAQESLSDALSVPVRFAATSVYSGVYGRYVNTMMTTGEPGFRSVRRMFGNALEEASTLEEITLEEFLLSIRGASLYCDFLWPLPLSTLAGLLDASSPDERPVRALTLTGDENGVALGLWDGDGHYYRCPASVSRWELEQMTAHYELGNGVFAADLSDTEAAYRTVNPLSLFAEATPTLPAYAVVSGLSNVDSLLTVLRFNPLTRSRYTETNGTEVIMEGGRSIRIRANGSVYYQDSGRGGLSVDSVGEDPTAWEAVRECAALLNGVLLPQGRAALCPTEVRREERVTTIRFGCAVDGLPVFYADGGAAAVVTLDGRNISSMELRPRRYTPTDTPSLLLPLSQALGVATLHPGAELCLGYQDNGGTRLTAQWFSSEGA